MLTPLMAACLAGGALPLAAQTMLQGAEGAPGLPAAPAPAVQVQAAPLLIPAAQMANDDVIVEMHQAFRKRDKNKLSQLLPASRGHVLEPWAAYWELRVRLQEATQDEVQSFLTRWAGTYQEDRMRNDWLRLLGQRRDWSNFDALYPAFRMGDDRELRCYAAVIDLAKGKLSAQQVAGAKSDWYAQRDSEDGCNLAGSELFSAGKLAAFDVNSGDRIWTATEGANSPVQVAGGSIFLVSDQGKIVRLDAKTGDQIWSKDLPYYTKDKPKRQRDIVASYGPVLAGNKLFVASSDGVLRVFSPIDGSLIGQAKIPGGAATDPVVAGRTLYVVGGDGKLHAFQ